MNLLWMIVITVVLLQTPVFFTRSGLELNPAVGLLMHLELSLFTGIVPRQWAVVHRKHHHFSDQEGDPAQLLHLGLVDD